MQNDEIFDVPTTLAFWQEAARRLALAGHDGDGDDDLGPVTSEMSTTNWIIIGAGASPCSRRARPTSQL